MATIEEEEKKELLETVELAHQFEKNAQDYIKAKRAELAVNGFPHPDLERLWKEWLYMQLAFLTRKSGQHDILALGG